MKVVRSLDRARSLARRSVVTIGNFDGVHHGHRVILERLRREADSRGGSAVVLTFDPHPIAVVRPDAAPLRLMTLADRLRALASERVDLVVVQRFTPAFAAIEAEEFVQRFLVEILDADKILVGHDLNFGRGRRGSVATLAAAGRHSGFEVEVVGPVDVDGVVVHSSLIRAKVAAGDVAAASKLLGRPHRVNGRVARGAGRGRGLGFATANLRPSTPAVPAEGVYATYAWLDGRSLPSVTSIGRTPTFGGEGVVIEAHIFAELGDLYGRRLGLDFVERIRPQRRFESPAALVEQIARDVTEAKGILGSRDAP